MTPNDDVMESVSLAPPENETEVTHNDDDGDDPPQTKEEEEEETLSSSDTTTPQAFEHLKESSMRLGYAISSSALGVDQKLGFTKAMEQLDDKTHVSQAVKNASNALGGWFRGMDATLGVTDSVKDLSTEFHAHVVEPLKAQPVIQESTRNLIQFDETHGITRSAASTLAKGADLLTKHLVGEEDVTALDSSNMMMTPNDKDKREEE